MVIKWNVNLGMKVQLEGSDIVEKFVYLGTTVTTTGGAGEDITAGSVEKAQARTSGETVNLA